MKIGVIGLGVVGSAAQYGFKKLGHEVYAHDIKYDESSIVDVVGTDVCYICVPSPSEDTGECDTSIVRDVVSQLNNLGYRGVVVIKSTVTPTTTQDLILQYPKLRVCFVPEFLRERCAVVDFTENHDVCIIGTKDESVFNIVKESHGHYPEKFIKVSPTEAEVCKYFNNIYNASLVILANSFYEVCEKVGADYTTVKNAMVKRDHITDIYLACNKSFRGFGGMCLPKDTKAIAYLCDQLHIDVDFFKTLLSENEKYRITVFEGMRSE